MGRNDDDGEKANVSRRNILLAGTTLAAASVIGSAAPMQTAQAQQQGAPPSGQRPNILVIFGDDIGLANISAYSHGLMGYQTPNIDRIGREGMMFMDYYAEQSCTAGRSSFITGQATMRTGLSKVGVPGVRVGLQARDAPLPSCSSRSAMPPASSVRITWAIATNIYRPSMASTSSSATSTISMPRRSRRTSTTQETPASARSSVRAGS
jgi:Sulfatase